MTIIEKDIAGHKFSVLSADGGSALFDTVPALYAEAWLDAAPDAQTLILCGADPYPKCVARFIEARPNGKVYAAPYVAYTLDGILGDAFSCTQARDITTARVGDSKIKFQTVCQPGKSAYLIADAGEAGTVSGAEPDNIPQAARYDRPTVVVAYVSGCDYTEVAAEKLAEGIRGSEGLDVRLCDLASMDVQSVVGAMLNAGGVLIGTPMENSSASRKIWALLNALPDGVFAGKFASAFGSYTWNGDAVPHVIERMRQLKMKLPDGGFLIQYRPDEAVLSSAYEYGYSFGCKLQSKPNTHQSTLVRCLICGEIFDSALGVCPVCGAGLDQCVPVDDEIIGYAEDTNRAYVIAGGGTAALSAASAIRKRDKTGRITMISVEDSLPINRPMLTKNMAVAAQTRDSMLVKTPEWFEENNIDIRLNTSVTAIDPEDKRASLSDGTALAYDKLIWAAGAECFVPDIHGRELDGVVTVRHLSDVFNIWSRRNKAKTAVVIGGGVLGLEVASELKKMYIAVTVLEQAPRLMPRQLDDDTSTFLTAQAERYGVKIRTGVIIAEIVGDGSVSGVRTDDGMIFPADIVVMSCGNKATVEVLCVAGAECGGAVKVTSRMETTLPDVYACGDCASVDGANFQLWSEATEQGRVAGANAVGDRVKYNAVSYGASFEGMNTRLFAIGDVGRGGKDYKLVETRDGVEGSCKKYWFCEGRLCGGVLYGNTDGVQSLTDAFLKGSTYAEVKGLLYLDNANV